jgi:hypothetical protein
MGGPMNLNAPSQDTSNRLVIHVGHSLKKILLLRVFTCKHFTVTIFPLSLSWCTGGILTNIWGHERFAYFFAFTLTHMMYSH